jgi:O-antigen ligase
MASPAQRPALAWRSLALRLALVAIPAWFTIAVLVFRVPLAIKLIISSMLALSVVSPVAGLLTVAALTPFGTLLAQFAGDGLFRMSEALVLTFFVGWLLRALNDRPGPGVPTTIGWLLAVAVAASVGGIAWQLRRYPEELAETGRALFYAYYRLIDRVGFLDGPRLVEGLALTAATVALFRQRPRLAVTLPIALTLSAIVAAASSLLLWWGIGPADALARYARIGYRVSAHVGDVNAAGSYFGMILCLILGMAARSRGRGRAAWMAAAVVVGLGLWLSHSRTAVAAAMVAIAGAVAWFVSSSWRPTIRAITLGSLVVAALALGGARVYLLEQDPAFRGAGFRGQFNATSLRMIAARPLFGVGMGRYYHTSPLFLSPQLAWTYGAENAHNYFLQVAAELGLPGLGLFAAWIGVVLFRAMNALGRNVRPVATRASGSAFAHPPIALHGAGIVTPTGQHLELLGATAGVVVLLGTCLTGHPLLVDQVAFPFWIQFGLVAGLSGSVLLNAEMNKVPAARRRPRGLPLAAAVAAAACVLLSGPVSAARRVVEPPASRAVDGFYGWETDADGTRFRWTEDYASLFVPANVTQLSIPVRLPIDRPAVAPIGVEVAVGGVLQGRTSVGTKWLMVPVQLPPVWPLTWYKRIDMKIDRTWQPAVYVPGSADMRAVGIQVGEFQIVR